MKVPVRIDRRTFYPDLERTPREVQDEAVRLLRFLEEYGPDHPDLPILENRKNVYLCACRETHCLKWIVDREDNPVQTVFGFRAKLVLVTRLMPRA